MKLDIADSLVTSIFFSFWKPLKKKLEREILSAR